MLSPYFFALYIDELLNDLRNLGVGCHIGGLFVGALGYDDDIFTFGWLHAAVPCSKRFRFVNLLLIRII